MFIKSYHCIFLTTLTFGTITAISANSWFTSWLGLEINLISIIPLILTKINKNLTEAAIKYFLIQAMASTLLIISVNSNFVSSESSILFSSELLIIFALLIKSGIPPFHFWFPEITNNLNWVQCFLLFTWQKIAPLLLISCIKLSKILIIVALAVSVGAIGGLNQIQLKPLLAYSRIAHSGWIILAAAFRLSLWLTYFVIYSLLSYTIVFTAFKSNLKKISDFSSWEETYLNKCLFSINILSLGGLPPFLGFAAKLSILAIIIPIKLNLLLLTIVLISLISLFYYLRLTYRFLINSPLHKPAYFNSIASPKNSILITCTSLNIIAPIIICLI